MTDRSSNRLSPVEWALIFTIAAILAGIAIPNYRAMKDREREAQTKSNMHSLQRAIEDFWVKFDGTYPESFDELAPFTLNPRNLWTNQPAPVLFRNGYPEESERGARGTLLVFYPHDPRHPELAYIIRGISKEGTLLRFKLTNEM